jgi:hypothetical protein
MRSGTGRLDTGLVPSIKGTVLAGHAEILNKHLAAQCVDPSILCRHFEPGDLEVLRGWIHPTAFYDIRLYTRLLEYLRDHVGDGSQRYLIDAGRRSADQMIRAGVYPEFEYLKWTRLTGAREALERFAAFGIDLRNLLTIHHSMLNYAPNRLRIDPDFADRYMIEHTGAEAYPLVLCWTTQGFCNRMAEEHGCPDLWVWERPSAELMWYRMTRPV